MNSCRQMKQFHLSGRKLRHRRQLSKNLRGENSNKTINLLYFIPYNSLWTFDQSLFLLILHTILRSTVIQFSKSQKIRSKNKRGNKEPQAETLTAMDEGRKAVKKVAGEKKFKHINIQRSTETLTPSLIWRKDYFSKYGKK